MRCIYDDLFLSYYYYYYWFTMNLNLWSDNVADYMRCTFYVLYHSRGNASFTCIPPTRDEIKILSNGEIDPSIETWIVEKLTIALPLIALRCHINEASTLFFYSTNRKHTGPFTVPKHVYSARYSCEKYFCDDPLGLIS